jgi:Subtilisin inhibitor-like
MRGLAVLALCIVALATSVSGSAAGSSASLRVSFWDGGTMTGRPDSTWTLRCNPVGGTLSRPARACGRLAASGPKLFAAIPPSTVCTQIYGGPQQARVVGTIGGKRVWATFSRTNGCEISRWDRVSPWLLPPGGVTR